MFIAIGFMVFGGIAGFMLRKKKMKHISKAVTTLIWMLLFILGLEVGGNSQVISGLMTIGMEAFIITIGAVAGSAIAAMLLWKYITKKKPV